MKDPTKRTCLKMNLIYILFGQDIERAERLGWASKIDPCNSNERHGYYKAVLDSTAGFVIAYKSCLWAKFLAEQAGVKFILEHTRGRATRIGPLAGQDGATESPFVVTADGCKHIADLVVVAGECYAIMFYLPPEIFSELIVNEAGGWTPTILPEVRDLLETTAGSIATITIPPHRSDLWDRFSPDKFPVVTWGMRDTKGIYSFPRDENGVIKIGYRGTKEVSRLSGNSLTIANFLYRWTNYQNVQGCSISVPKTAHITEQVETNIPMKAMLVVKGGPMPILLRE